MSDFATTYAITRKRFEDEVAGLGQEQLNWKLFPGANSIGQMAIHVAGVEVLFASQLTGTVLDASMERVKRCATEGTVNGAPFPFSDEEIGPDLVQQILAASKAMAQPLIDGPTAELRQREIVSALGPVITGEGALARLSFHPGYHQGQAYQIKSAPGFPK